MAENLELDSDFTTQQYRAGRQNFVSETAPAGSPITSLNGLSGPSVTLDGGTSGFSFSTAPPNVVLAGPLTTKGDIYVHNGSVGTRLGVGANDSRLVADSSQATGLRWQSPSTGWTAATGTATRGAFDTATVTLPQLAERLKALIDDLLSQKEIKP